MPSFHDVRFPPDISYGASGGPAYATTVIATVSGHEHRNVNWSQARGRWNVAHGLKTRQQVAELIAFFRARKGRAHGFRFKDWTDFEATGQLIGVGDGATTAFQQAKTYSSGGEGEVRTITKPVAGTVAVFLNGAPAGGWTVDPTTGLVTFAVAPSAGVAVTASFEFDVPARFDTDHMDITVETYDLARWAQIPVVEIRS